MGETDEGSLRHRALRSAKDFKTSWVELGQVLFTVWKDKLYKDWGYQEFDTYAAKEVGIRKQTALKLLKSYSFLEREEPRYLKKEFTEDAEARTIPTYEAVDVLRQASRNGEIDRGDYAKIRKYVLEDGKDSVEVKKDLTAIIREREELDPGEAREKKRLTVLKRLLSLLKSVRKEIKMANLLPETEIREISSLIGKLEAEVPQE